MRERAWDTQGANKTGVPTRPEPLLIRPDGAGTIRPQLLEGLGPAQPERYSRFQRAEFKKHALNCHSSNHSTTVAKDTVNP